MPWQEASIVDQRREFVRLAMQERANWRELCRRFGIHPDTGYKWHDRWASGEEELRDHSRRPHSSPRRSEAAMEARVLSVRDAHPAWGARKIARRLQDQGIKPPALSTVHAICNDMTVSLRRLVRNERRSVSRSLLPICCGKWTSRVGAGLPTAARAIR